MSCDILNTLNGIINIVIFKCLLLTQLLYTSLDFIAFLRFLSFSRFQPYFQSINVFISTEIHYLI